MPLGTFQRHVHYVSEMIVQSSIVIFASINTFYYGVRTALDTLSYKNEEIRPH